MDKFFAVPTDEAVNKRDHEQGCNAGQKYLAIQRKFGEYSSRRLVWICLKMYGR